MTEQIQRRKIKRTPNKQGSLSAGLKAEREEKKRFTFASLTGRGPRPRSLGTSTRSPHTAIVSRPNSSPRYTYLARCDRLAGLFSARFQISSRRPLASGSYTTHIPRWTRGGPVLEENNENAVLSRRRRLFISRPDREFAPRRNQREDVIYRPFS